MSRNPMPWHRPESPLTLVDTDDLLQELSQRGVACGISLVRKDGNMRANAWNLALICNGSPSLMLWSVNNLLEKAIVAAEDAGMTDDEIQSVLAKISYNPADDPTRYNFDNDDEDEQ